MRRCENCDYGLKLRGWPASRPLLHVDLVVRCPPVDADQLRVEAEHLLRHVEPHPHPHSHPHPHPNQVAFPILQKANQAATEAGADGAAPAPDDGASDDGQGPTVEEVD